MMGQDQQNSQNSNQQQNPSNHTYVSINVNLTHVQQNIAQPNSQGQQSSQVQQQR